MKTIELEDDVCAELDRLTNRVFSHSDVIRKLLLSANSVIPSVSPIAPTPGNEGIVGYVQSADYRMLTSGIKKYLAVLGWLYKTHKSDFQKVENYKRGNRLYFARSERAIKENGQYAQVKQIPNTPIWTMATLDNPTKRKILAELLHSFAYAPGDINTVISTITDSGRHRGPDHFLGF